MSFFSPGTILLISPPTWLASSVTLPTSVLCSGTHGHLAPLLHCHVPALRLDSIGFPIFRNFTTTPTPAARSSCGLHQDRSRLPSGTFLTLLCSPKGLSHLSGHLFPFWTTFRICTSVFECLGHFSSNKSSRRHAFPHIQGVVIGLGRFLGLEFDD